MKRLFSIVLISIISVCTSIAIHSYSDTDSVHSPSTSKVQTLRWAKNATSEQRRIIGAMIENLVFIKGGIITMGDTTRPLSYPEATKKMKKIKSFGDYMSYISDVNLIQWLTPVYNDTLSDYFIGKYEVTQEEWEAVMNYNPSYFKGSRKPVDFVNYIDCGIFIRKLNELTGLEFSLPTTEQWEYAARGGHKSHKNYEDQKKQRIYRKYSDEYSDDSISSDNEDNFANMDVGSMPPNIVGLYDMYFPINVMELCHGWHIRKLPSRITYKKRASVNMPFNIKNKYFNYSNKDLGLRIVVNANCIYTEQIKKEFEKKGRLESLPLKAHWQSGRNVIIKTDVIGDSIYADGTYIGTSPIATELPLCSQQLRITRYNNGKQTEITKNITVGQDSIPLTLNFNLTLGCYTSNLNNATDEQRRVIGELIESMALVEGGTFIMGEIPKRSYYDDGYYKIPHKVTLSDYYIGKYEVTQEQWQAVMGKNPSKFKGSRKPVESVSWNDCQEFIKKLNQLTGLNFALPTEAQWEYAARGGNKSQGSEFSGSDSFYDVWLAGRGGAKEVGLMPPNELGLYDMSGNVWEWCHDWYESYGYRDQTDPKGPPTGEKRIRRGGSWASDISDCTVTYRYENHPDFVGNGNIGLRLVVNPN